MYTITGELITRYVSYLRAGERAAATVEKFTRDLRALASWLGGLPVTPERAVAYKQAISATHAPSSVNSMLVSLNGFFQFMAWEIRLKALKIQRSAFLSSERELTRAEYERLLAAAQAQEDERLHLVMQAICSTGIRVSELKFITVEAARSGTATVRSKGKVRPVFLPKKLKVALLRYCQKRGLVAGCIFITAQGKPLDRRHIWADMKKLCATAQVAPSKVFPHNLRHLFARCFYAVEKDIMRLADILGHSDVNTTRIYVMESGEEHRKRVEKLGLVT
jgi:site-specific recombinase XerD